MTRPPRRHGRARGFPAEQARNALMEDQARPWEPTADVLATQHNDWSVLIASATTCLLELLVGVARVLIES